MLLALTLGEEDEVPGLVYVVLCGVWCGGGVVCVSPLPSPRVAVKTSL